MNAPNRITLMRILAAPALVICLNYTTPIMQYVSALIFLVASLTDLLDGYLARKHDQITDFGKFIDPIADKLLITTAMIVMVGQGRMSDWVVIIFVAREFVVNAFRLIASVKGVVIAADRLGKYKTLTQTIAVIMLILLKPAGDYAPMITGTAGAIAADIVTYIALALSIVSCINYISKNREILDLMGDQK